MTALRMFIPISKVDATQRLVYGVATAESEDRSGEVCDYATTKPFYERWSGDIAKATDGKSYGNVRAMHGKVAAGKVTALTFNDDAKQIEICAKVVDDAEWNKVVEGVYTGFSQGGEYVKRWKDTDGLQRYTASPSEVSLVDLPCLPDATFQMIKMDGVAETKKFASVIAAPTNNEIVEKARDLAKAAGKEEWSDFITAARDALIKSSLPPLPDVPKAAEATPAAPSEGLEQVWKAKDGQTFAKKAEAIAHNEELAAAEAIEPVTKGVLSELTALAEKVGIEKKDSGEAMDDGSFPIKTKTDLANAVKAYGQAKDPDAAKKHITARAKALDATDLLPSDWPGSTKKADKAARAALMVKGLPTLGRLAYLIEDLTWVKSAVHMEAKQENDGSPLPAMLLQNITDLCATLNAMCTEETAELIQGQNVDDLNNVPDVFSMAADLPADHLRALVKLTAGTPDLVKASAMLVKAGARHNKADKDKIQAMHDAACDLGANCDAGNDPDHQCGGGMDGKGHKPADLEKAVSALNKATAERNALQKTISEEIVPMIKQISVKVDEIEAVKKSVQEMKDLPRPVMFPGARAVSKSGSDSSVETEPEKAIAKLAQDDPDQFRLMMIKIAQQNPIQMGPAR